MPVKFNQYWTVDFDKTQAYEKFIIRDYIPGVNKLGIHIVAGWSVLIGGYSENVLEGISNDLELLEKALRDKKYKELNDELQNYIKKYNSAINNCKLFAVGDTGLEPVTSCMSSKLKAQM